jgi:ribosomal protein L7Ae-like RNA K-turn-binding protein
MNERKVLSYIGLAMKAGKLATGEYSVEKAIKEGTARIVIIAGDASDNTFKKFNDMCTYRGIELIKAFDKAALGHLTGKEIRASVAILDEGFAKAVRGCFIDGGNVYSEKESI